MRTLFIVFALVIAAVAAQPSVREKEEPKICTDCKAFLEDIKDLIAGPDVENEILKKIDAACLHLPESFSTTCQIIAHEWIKHMFMFLSNKVPFGMICQSLDFCGTSQPRIDHLDLKFVATVTKDVLTGQSGVACKACKLFVNEAKTMVSDGSLQDLLEELVGEACMLLPPSRRDECHVNIKRIGDLVAEIIEEELDADSICESLRVCPMPNNQPQTPVLHSVLNKLTSKVTNALHSLNTQLPAFKDVQSGNIAECRICMLLMTEAQNFLKSKEYQDEMLTTIEGLCTLFPEPLDHDCEKFISETGHQVIELVLEMLSPKVICSGLGMCDQDSASKETPKPDLIALLRRPVSGQETSTQLLKKAQAPASVRAPKAGEALWCSICKQIATLIQTAMESEQLNEGIIFLGRRMCSIFPGTLKDQCDDMVQRLTLAILSSLGEAVDPETLCSFIGVCDSSHLTPMHYDMDRIAKDKKAAREAVLRYESEHKN